MPQLEGADLIFLLIIVAFIIWEVQAIIKTHGKIQLQGKVYGRAISMGILVVLGGVAMWRRWSELGRLWPILVALVGCTALYMTMKAGFGDQGMYFNGKLVKYPKINHYNIERETETGFSLRINTGNKDYVLDFSADQSEAVLAYLGKGQVPDAKTAKSMGR